MKKKLTISLVISTVMTLITLLLWAGTGGHYYTKYEIVQKKKVPVSADDLLAGTGFYDGEEQTILIHRNEFHFGLFPTPQNLLDKHIFSVATFLIPVWGISGVLIYLNRRNDFKRKAALITQLKESKSE